MSLILASASAGQPTARTPADRHIATASRLMEVLLDEP
jgi:hypothetical protein